MPACCASQGVLELVGDRGDRPVHGGVAEEAVVVVFEVVEHGAGQVLMGVGDEAHGHDVVAHVVVVHPALDALHDLALADLAVGFLVLLLAQQAELDAEEAGLLDEARGAYEVADFDASQPGEEVDRGRAEHAGAVERRARVVERADSRHLGQGAAVAGRDVGRADREREREHGDRRDAPERDVRELKARARPAGAGAALVRRVDLDDEVHVAARPAGRHEEGVGARGIRALRRVDGRAAHAQDRRLGDRSERAAMRGDAADALRGLERGGHVGQAAGGSAA